VVGRSQRGGAELRPLLGWQLEADAEMRRIHPWRARFFSRQSGKVEHGGCLSASVPKCAQRVHVLQRAIWPTREGQWMAPRLFRRVRIAQTPRHRLLSTDGVQVVGPLAAGDVDSQMTFLIRKGRILAV